MQLRTDLAIERFAALPHGEGVSRQDEQRGDIQVHRVQVHTQKAARELGKDKGRYVTLCDRRLALSDTELQVQQELSCTLAEEIRPLLPEEGCVLAVGLGNRHITADALGSWVIEKLLVTRQLQLQLEHDANLPFRSVCAIAPGVLGITGIETAEMVRGIVDRVRPSAVIAIDALAAREAKRICSTVQITDTGISPGSGVGNHRMGLSRETLGVPVIAVGVPMVVYASGIIRDALSLLVEEAQAGEYDAERAVEGMVERVTKDALGELVVTPREVDLLLGRVASVLALGLNMALQPSLQPEDILMLVNDHL
ncbi:MAG: GPR endopeptidase [Clostridiales bacterium]|nr:GPR endopeptidase [Clostridiales bacterium]